MKVLFLDIDGVLNSHDYCDRAGSAPIHRDKVQILNGILDATGAYVVLSSAWRYMVYRGEMTMSGLDWLLRSHGMRGGRFAGITRKDTADTRHAEFVPLENERGRQITDWLGENCVATYAVVDDLDLGITAEGHPFVKTDGNIGITVANGDRLIEILAKK